MFDIQSRIAVIEKGIAIDETKLKSQEGKHALMLAQVATAYEASHAAASPRRIPSASSATRRSASTSDGSRWSSHLKALAADPTVEHSQGSSLYRPSSATTNKSLNAPTLSHTAQRAQSARARRLLAGQSPADASLIDTGVMRRSAGSLQTSSTGATQNVADNGEPNVPFTSFAEAKAAFDRTITFIDAQRSIGTLLLNDLRRAMDYYYSEADNYSDAFVKNSEAPTEKIIHSPRSRALIYTGKSISALIADSDRWVSMHGNPLTDALKGMRFLTSVDTVLAAEHSAEDCSHEPSKRLLWSSMGVDSQSPDLQKSSLPEDVEDSVVSPSSTFSKAQEKSYALAHCIGRLSEVRDEWAKRWEVYVAEVKALSHPDTRPIPPRHTPYTKNQGGNDLITHTWSLQTLVMLGLAQPTEPNRNINDNKTVSSTNSPTRCFSPKSKSAAASRMLTLKGSNVAKVFPQQHPLAPSVTSSTNQRLHIVGPCTKIPQPPLRFSASQNLGADVEGSNQDVAGKRLASQTPTPPATILHPTMHGTIQSVLAHSARSRQTPDCLEVSMSVEGTERPVPIGEWPTGPANDASWVLKKANSYSRFIAAGASASVRVTATPNAIRRQRYLLQQSAKTVGRNISDDNGSASPLTDEVIDETSAAIKKSSRPSSGVYRNAKRLSRPASASNNENAGDHWTSSRRAFKTRDTLGESGLLQSLKLTSYTAGHDSRPITPSALKEADNHKNLNDFRSLEGCKTPRNATPDLGTNVSDSGAGGAAAVRNMLLDMLTED